MSLRMSYYAWFHGFGGHVRFVNGELCSGLVVHSMSGEPLDALVKRLDEIGHPYDLAELDPAFYKPINVIVRAKGFHDHVAQSGPLSEDAYELTLDSKVSLYWRTSTGGPFFEGTVERESRRIIQRDPVLVHHLPRVRT